MQIKNNIITDDEGRELILRGVNLGGDSKIPLCKNGEEILPSFLDRKNNVSFIGRPFPLEEAENHFKRLKKSGMTFLRLLVTWEAVEHEGPGIYDEAYLAYLRKILLAAEKEGISVFIDPHQDVWSRWTGGDGAPAWTMEKLGMDLDMMDSSGAAITRQRYSMHNKSKKYPEGKPYPKMIWPSNYNRYAAAVMFSLFYAGRAFAPDLQVEGENVQDWLQNRYTAAFCHVKRRLKNCAAIAGWGTMNEPHNGLIGHQNLKNPENVLIPSGQRPSPWQSILATSGYTQKIPVYTLSSYGRFVSHYEIINEKGISLFREGYCCPWKQAGVWQDGGGKPELLKPDHFAKYRGQRVIFADDFLKPFLVKYISAMKDTEERSFFFIEGLPDCAKEESHPSWNREDPSNTLNAFHWYDGFSLFTKSFRSWFTINVDTRKPVFGEKKAVKCFTENLAKGIGWTNKKMGNMPCLLGEFGLAFDINNRKGFKNGDYSLHEKALSMYYDAVDANLLHSTIWNYTVGNTNRSGDNWNDEDLSIFSEGKERAAAGWKRPYPMATAGKLLSFNWDRKRKIFSFCFSADKQIKAPSVIYLPSETFGDSPVAETALRCEYSKEEQLLLIYNDNQSGETEIKVRLNR
ncbi:MAG: cellulase family glycosylhydrolase [Treponema sp.]|nr:cellulase family glycosylhydrolase [Treponema sp.]MCL2271752.1 cellulase family glycosylhydrolase [Treponema sp.]